MANRDTGLVDQSHLVDFAQLKSAGEKRFPIESQIDVLHPELDSMAWRDKSDVSQTQHTPIERDLLNGELILQLVLEPLFD